MLAPEKPWDEAQRLAELYSLGLLDTAPEERFDRITRLARRLFGVRTALVSLVEGGLTSNKTCVVTARVMLLTVTPAMKAVLLRPQKTAIAFDAVAASSTDGCRAVAKDKLKEATIAVVSALVKS